MNLYQVYDSYGKFLTGCTVQAVSEKHALVVAKHTFPLIGAPMVRDMYKSTVPTEKRYETDR
jgi:hypothetical protein